MKNAKLLLLLAALLVCVAACGPKENSPETAPTQAPITATATPEPVVQEPISDELDEKFVVLADVGKVISAKKEDNAVYIVAEGFYGYHMDENPSISIGVTINDAGGINSLQVVDMKGQTAGFGEQVTEDYLNTQFVGQAAFESMDVDTIAGATLSARAALYAVRTAAYYVANVYGYVADTGAEDIAELNALFPAEYKKINSDDVVDKKVGTVLFAAEGITKEGTNVVAMKVSGAKALDTQGASYSGFETAEPAPYTMVIVVDTATNQVVFWHVLKDGTNKAAYFVVPAETIDAYKAVAITSADVFDNFDGGLVKGMDYAVEDRVEYGGIVITGTTILYTGATQSGTFSSQMVRSCFKTAAAFYISR
jgi:FMN-binding domain.